MEPVCVYSVQRFNEGYAREEESFGMLYYAEIEELGDIPEDWTYPEIQPKLMEKADEWKKKGKSANV